MRPELPLHVTDIAPSDGRGSGPHGETFVLLHGYAANSFTWRHWVTALSARGRVIMVDMKGFGEAPKPDDGKYDPLHFASLIADLLERLEVDNVTLIGHSLGGGIALLATLTLEDRGERRVRRLIVISGAAYRQRLPPFVALAHRPRLSAALVRLVGPRFIIRRALLAIVHDRDTVTDAQVAAYAEPLEKADGVRALLEVGRRIVPEEIDELSARYREIDVPVLLLWGRHDRVIPVAIGRRLEAELPRARLEILDDCGHLPPEELPEASLAIVESFLEDHPTV